MQPLSPAWKNQTWTVIAFKGQFERARRVLQRAAGEKQPIFHQIPLPWHNASCQFTNGSQSAAATHAKLWKKAVETQRIAYIFEEDVAIGNYTRMEKELTRAQTLPSDLFFLGFCGRATCSHAYRVTAKGASRLLRAYHSYNGCVESDGPIVELCTRGKLLCAHAQGFPGKGLWGNGVVGQNKSLSRYLHDRSCRDVPRANWAAVGCRTIWDYSKFADTTVAHRYL